MVIMNSIVYSKIISIIQEEVEQSSITSLRQIRKDIESKIIQMDNIALSISNQTKLSTFMLENNAYDIYTSINLLNEIKFTHPYIYDIILYHYRVPEKLYAASGIYDMNMFFDRMYNYDEWNKDEFQGILDTLQIPYIRPVENIKINNTSNEAFITYMFPLPIKAMKPKMMAMFLIKYTEFTNTIDNAFKDHNGTFFLVNRYDELIGYTSAKEQDDEGISFDLLNMELLRNTVNNVKLEDKHYTIIKLESKYKDLTYVMAIHTNQLMEKVNNGLYVLKIVTVIVLVLGLLISLYLAFENYKPLKKLIVTVKSQIPGMKLPQQRDEFKAISNIIDEIAKENSNIKNKLRGAANSIKANIILALLQGKFRKEEEIDNLLAGYSISMDGPYYTVINFTIDEYNTFVEENTKEIQDLIKFSIINVIEELSENLGHGYATDLIKNDTIPLILNIDKDVNKHQYLIDLVKKTQELFQKEFNISLTASIGNIYENALMINNSYNEATISGYYRFIYGRKTILIYKNIKLQEKNSHSHFLEKEKNLIKEIKSTNINQTEKIIREVVNQIKINYLSIDSTQMVCMSLINAISRLIGELGIDTDNIGDIYFRNKIYDKFETLDDFAIWFESICCNISAYLDKNMSNKDKELLKQILNYINENYYDNTLCLKSIGAKFNFSPSYLTNYFKKHMGYSLMVYIDILRMDKVKELLKTTKLTIKDIRQQVGYIDEANFLRKFKKKEGMTPSQYRNIYKKN